MNRIVFYVLFIFLLSCQGKKVRQIIIDGNIKAVGLINTDSTYDGLIKFYDLKSDRLLYTSTYNNGILNGEQIVLYKNGTPSSIQNYSLGELNGYTNFYDSSGNLFSKQYSYYGIKAGHFINFNLNAPKEYGFYSLENELLFYLNYDSLKNKKITDLEESYFFFKTRILSNLSEPAGNIKKETLFICPDRQDIILIIVLL